MKERIIRIIEEASSDLVLRDIADFIFDKLEIMPDQKIQIDFSNILSISRSFAHQYTLRKRKSKKIITEINIPENIEKMLRVVDPYSNRAKILDADSMEAETISL